MKPRMSTSWNRKEALLVDSLRDESGNGAPVTDYDDNDDDGDEEGEDLDRKQ
jgi:hypothetical protein